MKHSIFQTSSTDVQPIDASDAATIYARVLQNPENVREAQNWISFYQEALDEAAILAVTNVHGTILSVNRKFCALSGYSREELIGANHRLLRSGVHDRAFFANLYQTICGGNVWHGEICNRAKSGKLYWVDTTIVPHRDLTGKLQSFTAIRFDITPQKKAEERWLNLASVDPLTNLPNRRRFMDVLERQFREGGDFTVGILDVDHFKDINDSLGHDAGDELLIEFARRLRTALGPSDFVARLGGDEFAILLRAPAGCGNIKIKMEQIFAALGKPVSIAGETHKLSVSIGASRYTNGSQSYSEILKHADIALYAAKDQGRGCYAIFDGEMRDKVESRARLFKDFSKGIDQAELTVFYQPIVSSETRNLVKIEALLRWAHPERGLVPPSYFQEALSDDRLSARAGEFVLDQVLRHIGDWKARGIDFGAVAINATTGDFRRPYFVNRLLSAIRSGEIAAHDICVEITEGILLGRAASTTRQAIDTLHAAGVMIAFDDFGTGFASLSHLSDIPVDIVKIDKSFVSGMEHSKKNRAIVESVIHLAHALEKKVVAEGVETAYQAEVLSSLSCDFMQGYLFSRPVAFEEVTRLIGR